jgi:hypothetical protein
MLKSRNSRRRESGDVETHQRQQRHFLRREDRPWVLAGANIQVSMIGSDDGSEKHHALDSRTKMGARLKGRVAQIGFSRKCC